MPAATVIVTHLYQKGIKRSSYLEFSRFLDNSPPKSRKEQEDTHLIYE